MEPSDEPIAQFRSSKDDKVVYEVFAGLRCTCPGFQFRQDCNHVQAVARWDNWGTTVPRGILDPPKSWEVAR